MTLKNKLDPALGTKLFDLRRRIAADFSAGNWEELGLLTGGTDIIQNHDRLLRSLSWGDEDYDGSVLTVLRQVVERDPRTLPVIEQYLDDNFPGEGTYVSAKPAERKITFAPHVFHVPDGYVELDLVALMMPFDVAFNPVQEAIKAACTANGLRCLRVDNIWEESAIIQDIFNLIFRSQVVLVDFTAKNPNVMYETGIAHTLGKHVIPITQSMDDVPFDMRHHRTLKYLANGEGLAELRRALKQKLAQFQVPPSPPPPVPTPTSSGDDDVPF